MRLAMIWVGVGAAIVRRSSDRVRLLHWTILCRERRRDAARREGESRQKREPHSAHAARILGKALELVNAAHLGCDELTVRPTGKAQGNDRFWR